MNVGASDPERRSFEAVPTSARAARLFVTDRLRDHGAAIPVICDYALVVSELATNIIEHGDGSHLTVSVDITDPLWWQVAVAGTASDAPSHVLQPDTWTVAGADEASGRGLGIVRHLMDDVSAAETDGLVTISCRRQRWETP